MHQQITLVGNLGSDPELRYTPAGVPVANFSVATSRSYEKDGKREEKTVWFRVTAWRKLAENCSQYLAKGSKVLVVGEMEEARVWTDKQGNNRASLEVTAQSVKFLSSKGEGSSSNSQGSEDTGYVEEDIPF